MDWQSLLGVGTMKAVQSKAAAPRTMPPAKASKPVKGEIDKAAAARMLAAIRKADRKDDVDFVSADE